MLVTPFHPHDIPHDIFYIEGQGMRFFWYTTNHLFPGAGDYKQVSSSSAEEFRFWEYKTFVGKELSEASLSLALVNNAISWWIKEPGIQ